MSEIAVEVVYALPEKQYLYTVKVKQGATVAEVIQRSGILELRPEIDINQTKVGVFSRPVKLTDTVGAGDRIEIYRPLLADPKELRRQRADRATKNKA